MGRDNKGSTTVEAAIVMPVVFIIIIIVIRMEVIHFQNIVTYTAAMDTASRTAAYWNMIGVDNPKVFRMGDLDNNDNISARWWIDGSSFRQHEPYAKIMEFLGGGHSKLKINNATDYCGKKTNKIPEIMGDDSVIEGVNIKRKRGVLQNYIEVTIERKSVSKVAGLFESLGLSGDENKTITAKAVQNDAVDFIRNISFLYECGK